MTHMHSTLFTYKVAYMSLINMYTVTPTRNTFTTRNNHMTDTEKHKDMSKEGEQAGQMNQL